MTTSEAIPAAPLHAHTRHHDMIKITFEALLAEQKHNTRDSNPFTESEHAI